MIKKYILYALVLLFFYTASGSVIAKPDVEDFLREKDYRSAVISPNGRYMAEVWNRAENHERIVTVTDLKKEGRPVIGKMADRITRPYAVSWANDERLLVRILVPAKTKTLIRKAEKDEDFDVRDSRMFERTIAVNRDGTDAIVLMENNRHLRAIRYISDIKHYLPDDPNHILMSVYKKGRKVLFKVNVNSGESELITVGGDRTYEFVSDYKGNLRYRLDYWSHAKKIKIFEYSNKGKWLSVDEISLRKEDEEGADLGSLLGIYEDNLVYRKKNIESGFYELVLYKRKEKTFETLVSLPDRDVLSPITNFRTQNIVGFTMDGDVVRRRYFDESFQAGYDELADKIGDYNFYYSSFSKNGNKAIVNVYGPDDPLSFRLYDRETKKLEFLQNAYFNIATKNLSFHARSTYLTRDGEKIRAYLLLPVDYKEGKKFPLIVLPHGGPQVRDRADYDDFAQFLSTRGYIVIQPNYRGSSGYGKAFEEAGYKQWGQLMQDDLTDAVDFMVRKGFADPDKVCIVGISYGGYAALMGAVKTPNLYKCSVSINGVTHLPDMISFDKKYYKDKKLISEYLYTRVGHPKHDAEMLKENSPALQARRIKIPVLLIAGTRDRIVDYGQAKKMVKALKKNSKKYKFIKLEDTGHNPFYYREDQGKVYTEVEKFLATYL